MTIIAVKRNLVSNVLNVLTTGGAITFSCNKRVWQE